MVVMDDLRDSHRCLSDCHGRALPFKAIRKLLHPLHQSGYVHGDVCSSNVLIAESEEDFMLLDFDWAGPIGKTRYPMNLNRSEGLWQSEGARDKQLILADHVGVYALAQG
jgi:hypothetical protein